MKIATYNVNGVNGRLPVLLRWLDESAARRRLPAGAEGAAGEVPRDAICRRPATTRSGTGRRAGTASPSSRAAASPIETRRGLPGDPDDTHSRYIEAAVGGVVDRLPVPAQRQSGARPEVRLQAPLVRAADRATPQSLLTSGEPVVLAGDYNVIPTELDVYKPERWMDDALFLPGVAGGLPPAARAGLDRRHAPAASGGARSTRSGTTSGMPVARDAGLRIDHLLLSPTVAGAAEERRRRSRRARLGEDQRPRADLDHAQEDETARGADLSSGSAAARSRARGGW